jgi:pyruvate-formate lyase-activating enzyme
MRCVFCLHPYTVILTDKGLYTIEEIFEASGNEIQYCGGFVRFPNNLHTYSYDGRKVRVVKVFKHHYNGDLLKIEASHAPPIKVTPSHEIVVYDGRGRVVKKPAKDLSHTHKLVIPFPRVEKKATATMDAEQILEPVADSTHHIVNVNSDSQLQALLLSEKNMQVKRMKQQVLYYLKDNQASVAARTLSKAKNVRNYVAVPIQRIERVSYSGPVYNLEVEDESHTYTANCLAVGNCQNSDISHDKDNGVVFTPQRLAWSMWQLRMEGCHNINLVGGEPTIHLHTIVQAIDMLKFFREFDAEAWSAKADAYIPYRLDPRNASYRGEFNTPILWNSNMYMSLETLRILRELVDIWLPDFKFGNNKCAIRLSRTPWYFETVAENHRLIYGWGEDIVIRHLIMPGHVECCTKPVLKWIAENMPEVPVNVMDQYHPDAYCNPADPRFDKRYVDMARYPTREEILEAYRYAESLGLNFGEITFERSLRGFRP